MHPKTFRVVLVAVACLGLAGVARLSFHSTMPTLATNTTLDDGHDPARDLILNSGYMVAVG